MKKNNLLFCLVTLLITILSVQNSSAQKTGLFEDTVTFSGVHGWPIWYYVPPDYNPAHKYKLIVGLQDNGDNPHDYLKYYMMPLDTAPGQTSLNAIFVAPSPRCASCDFFNDTAIITQAIRLTMSNYTIDNTHIYMNGFSMGGKAALRYGLINYWRFRGIEVRTPAIGGILEANDKVPSYYFPYSNGKYIPIAMTIGSNDTGPTGFDSYHSSFRTIVTTAYQNLYDSGAVAHLTTVYGMGHNSPHLAVLYNEYNYLDKNASSYATNDAGISFISTPTEECSASYLPVLTVQNKGINKLTTASVNYQIDNGAVQTQSWTGSLNRLGRNNITLPLQSLSAGAHSIKAYTSMPNGVNDTVPSNDTLNVNFNIISQGYSPVIAQGFETATFPPSGWKQTGTDSAWCWHRLDSNTIGWDFIHELETTNLYGAYLKSASCIYFDNICADNIGKKYAIHTPQYDFSKATNPILTFDYAYAPQSGSTGQDTLAVSYSTDCGATWSNLIKKGGIQLSTTGSYIDTVMYPNCTSKTPHDFWKTDTLKLNNVIGQSMVMFSFECRSDWGNMLYLDNITLGSAVTGIADKTQNDNTLGVYPNPNDGKFTVLVTSTLQCDYILELKNILGQVLYTEKLPEFSGAYTQQLALGNFGSGLYFVSLKNQTGETVKKIIIN